MSSKFNLQKSELALKSALIGDLNNFKLINGTMGYASGDKLLQVVADHLRTCVGIADTVSRR